MTVRRTFSLGLLAAIVLVSGSAFVYTFGSAVAFHDRDRVSAEPTELRVTDDAVVVTYTVSNPLDRPLVFRTATLSVYETPPPFEGVAKLTKPRRARLAGDDVRVGAGETTTLTVRAPLDADRERVERAVANGSATPSGLFEVRMADRQFEIEVVPDA